MNRVTIFANFLTILHIIFFKINFMFMSDWLVCMKCNSLTIKDASNMMRVRRKIGGYIVSHFKSNSHPF